MASSSGSELTEAEIAAQQKKFKRETRCAAFVVLGVIMVMCLCMGIIWAVVRPKRPIVAIEMGHITKWNISRTTLQANLEFVIRFYNPNKKATTYYDSIEFFNLFATGRMIVGRLNESFFQPAFNVTRVNCSFRIILRPMFGNINMTRYVNSGQFGVKISMKGKIRFKEGKWKSKPQTVGIYCGTRKVRLQKSYETTSCYVDL